MVQLIFRKWWLILIQGILLIVLSIYIFNNPVTVLAGLSFWFGSLVLVAGILGIFAWMSANKTGKENMSLFWSIITAVFGIWLLLNLTATMKTLTVVFGMWMLVTGVHLVQSGWSLKNENSMGWIMVIAGILSAVAALMIIFNISAGAAGISTLLGLQVLITGIALVILSFTKRAVMGIAKDKLESFHSGIRNK
jgi:uncharacterized membrane protein HdeD (DUF308 family)